MKALALFLLTACCAPSRPAEPVGVPIVLVTVQGTADTLGGRSLRIGVYPFLPPKEYRRWYLGAEQCAGLRGDVNLVTWFMAPAPWRSPHGRITYGYYERDAIVLNALMAGDSSFVRHESMHHILELNQLQSVSERHDTTYFNRRCATSVA